MDITDAKGDGETKAEMKLQKRDRVREEMIGQKSTSETRNEEE